MTFCLRPLLFLEVFFSAIPVQLSSSCLAFLALKLALGIEGTEGVTAGDLMHNEVISGLEIGSPRTVTFSE